MPNLVGEIHVEVELGVTQEHSAFMVGDVLRSFSFLIKEGTIETLQYFDTRERGFHAQGK